MFAACNMCSNHTEGAKMSSTVALQLLQQLVQGRGAYHAPTTRGMAMAMGTGVKRAILGGPKSLHTIQDHVS